MQGEFQAQGTACPRGERADVFLEMSWFPRLGVDPDWGGPGHPGAGKAQGERWVLGAQESVLLDRGGSRGSAGSSLIWEGAGFLKGG